MGDKHPTVPSLIFSVETNVTHLMRGLIKSSTTHGMKIGESHQKDDSSHYMRRATQGHLVVGQK